MRSKLTLLMLLSVFCSFAQQVRHIETVNEAWSFHKGNLELPLSEKITWDKVTIPHSWNTEDILDDEDGYYRGCSKR